MYNLLNSGIYGEGTARAATRAALASMQLIWAADQVAAEQDSLEGSSLEVGVEGGVGMSALFQTPRFV